MPSVTAFEDYATSSHHIALRDFNPEPGCSCQSSSWGEIHAGSARNVPSGTYGAKCGRTSRRGVAESTEKYIGLGYENSYFSSGRNNQKHGSTQWRPTSRKPSLTASRRKARVHPASPSPSFPSPQAAGTRKAGTFCTISILHQFETQDPPSMPHLFHLNKFHPLSWDAFTTSSISFRRQYHANLETSSPFLHSRARGRLTLYSPITNRSHTSSSQVLFQN